jgi:hypothetical protein
LRFIPEAIRHISFRNHRITIGYGNFSVRMSKFGDVMIKGQVLQNVPQHVEIDAKPSSSTVTPIIPSQIPQDAGNDKSMPLK